MGMRDTSHLEDDRTQTMAPPHEIGEGAGSGEVLLVVLVGPDAGARYRLTDELTIGREPDLPVCLRDDGISRRHTRIRRSESGTFLLEDLSSRNGTYLNGTRIATARLRSGDKIAIGSSTILLFTNHDRYEEQVLQAQKLHMLGQLAGGIVHDFNNLIVTVLGNVTYLKDGPAASPTDLAQCLDEIEIAARRAAELTAQLVSFARPQPQERQLVEVDSLVLEVAGLLRRTVPKTIAIVTNVEQDLRVTGDSSQLLQVLMNGCINATQAMRDGGELRLSARRSPPQPGTTRSVEILIEDTGPGMDEATRARAFQPFFTTKPRGEGTGLGLATAYRVIHGHGGEIALDSQPGRGTRLCIHLPEADHAAAAVPRPTLLPKVALTGRALVVDDEPLVRNTTRRMLERLGLSVVCAADGQEALQLHAAANDPFNLVVMDLDMPVLDGEQAIAALRQRSEDLPIIVASGHADGARTERLMNHPHVHILHKPFDVATLRHQVSVALGPSMLLSVPGPR